MTIDQYIAQHMEGKITKRAKSPVPALVLLVAGAALLVALRSVAMADSLQMVVLTIGVVALAVGLVLTAMALSKALWRYHYLPTNSPMKQAKLYLDDEGYNRCLSAIAEGKVAEMAGLVPVTSSNRVLHVLYSRDHAAALLQAGRLDSGHFEADTPVLALTGTEVAAIKMLCR